MLVSECPNNRRKLRKTQIVCQVVSDNIGGQYLISGPDGQQTGTMSFLDRVIGIAFSVTCKVDRLGNTDLCDWNSQRNRWLGRRGGARRRVVRAQPQRSLEHFSIGQDLIPREMITAYATLKPSRSPTRLAG
jgi:hypothetical protein